MSACRPSSISAIGEEKNDVAFLWTKLYKSISSFEFIIQKVNTKFGYGSNHTSDQIPCANYTSSGWPAYAHAPAFRRWHLFYPLVFLSTPTTDTTPDTYCCGEQNKIESSQLCDAQSMVSQASQIVWYVFVVRIIITEYKLPSNPEPGF